MMSQWDLVEKTANNYYWCRIKTFYREEKRGETFYGEKYPFTRRIYTCTKTQEPPADNEVGYLLLENLKKINGDA